MVPTGLVVLRYLLPLTLIVDAFAAHAVLALRRARAGGVPVCPVFALLCAWRLAIAVDLTYAQEHDTRYDAATWLAAHVHPGERVEYFRGHCDFAAAARRDFDAVGLPDARSLGRRARPWPGSDSDLFDGRVHGVPGECVPDWTSLPGMQHSADCPPDVYCSPL